MGRRTSELVPYELASPIFNESIAFSLDHTALTHSRRQIELSEVFKATYAMIDRARRNYPGHTILQGLSAGHDDPDADRAFAVESLEVLQIAIEERILVVPFDFQSDGTSVGSTHMVDFMRDRSPLHIVDGLPDDDIAFDPFPFRQGSSKPLRRFGLPASALDQLHIGDLETQKYATQLSKRLSEIAGENGRCVVQGPDVKSRPFEFGQAQGKAVAEWLL